MDGLFKITIPPSAEHKTLDTIDHLLTDKNELISNINDNKQKFNMEQLEYLKSLLNLEISVFHNEKINEGLVENPLFFYIMRYNLYEGILKLLKKINDINHNQIDIGIGLPYRNWLSIWAYTRILAFPLVEMELYPKTESEIEIYDSDGYTPEFENILIKAYKKEGKTKDEIDFRVEENKQKRKITKLSANEIINYWNIFDFDDNISMDKTEKGKILSFARIYKKNIDK